MTTTINKISFRWKTASWLLKIVYINVAIFLVLRILAVVGFFLNINANEWIKWIECPSSMANFVHQPWSIFSYMFAQFDVLHILFNMLWILFNVISTKLPSLTELSSLLEEEFAVFFVLFVEEDIFFVCFFDVWIIL